MAATALTVSKIFYLTKITLYIIKIQEDVARSLVALQPLQYVTVGIDTHTHTQLYGTYIPRAPDMYTCKLPGARITAETLDWSPAMKTPLWTYVEYIVLPKSIESVHCSHGEYSWQGGGHRCRDYINCLEHCFTDLVVMHLADDDGVYTNPAAPTCTQGV